MSGYTWTELEREYAKVMEDAVLRKLQKREWTLEKRETRNNVSYYGTMGDNYTDERGKYIYGLSTLTREMISPVGKSPEEIYFEKLRIEELGNVYNQIKALCTKSQKEVLEALSEFIFPRCSPKCPKIDQCTAPDGSEICKRHLKGNKYIDYNAAEKKLGKKKSYVSQILKRIRRSIEGKVNIDLNTEQNYKIKRKNSHKLGVPHVFLLKERSEDCRLPAYFKDCFGDTITICPLCKNRIIKNGKCLRG